MAGPSRITPRCALHRLVAEHYAGDHLRDAQGVIHLDVTDVAGDFGTVLGVLIQAIPDRAKRRAALRFAHACLDAGVTAARTGTLVPVDGAAAREH